MGDMAGYYDDYKSGDNDEEFNGYHYSDIWNEYISKRLMWETKDGINLSIKNMSNEHINNVISYISKSNDNHAAKNAWIFVFKYELERRKNG